jgi:branched-chain amino acid transport system substrate-binding protein
MKTLVLAASVIAAAAVAATAGGARMSANTSSCGATLGVIAPVTGQAAVVGEEIVNWTRLALANWNKANHTKFKLVEADTQFNPAKASTIAQQFASNKKLIATIGPAASQEVAVAGPILNRAHIAMVSPSATQTALTVGATFHNFFRVVARDDAQGPTAANYIVQKLHAKSVMIVDDQSSFSTGLAASAGSVLQTAGVKVQRESVTQQATDFSSLIAKIGGEDVVFLTWQLPENIKLFIQQMRQQGKTTPTFATTFDGTADYVSSFSINVHTYAPGAALARQYEKQYGKNYTGQFGPPSYVSAQVLMKAVGSLCAANKPVTRANVLAAVRKVRLSTSLIGRAIAFDNRGDLVNGRFYIYKLVNGSYRLMP